MGVLLCCCPPASDDGEDGYEKTSDHTPIVMMHGMGDFANNPLGMVPLRKRISKNAGAYVHSVELCSKPEQLGNCSTDDQSNGFLMTMDTQVDQFAHVVRADPQLANDGLRGSAILNYPTSRVTARS